MKLKVSHSKNIMMSGRSEAIYRCLSDPFLFSSISGHMLILEVYDHVKGGYVTLDKVEKPAPIYKVLYVFGDLEGEMSTELGVLKGPQIIQNELTYEGEIGEKFMWRIAFKLTPADNEVMVDIDASQEEEKSILNRVLHITKFNFVYHITEAHIVPYLKKIKSKCN